MLLFLFYYSELFRFLVPTVQQVLTITDKDCFDERKKKNACLVEVEGWEGEVGTRCQAGLQWPAQSLLKIKFIKLICSCSCLK